MPDQIFEPTIKRVSADERGEIYSIALPGDKELMLLHSRAGVFRGGHSHDVAERVLVLTGRMLYHKHQVTGEWETTLEELVDGGSAYNHSGQVHMGEFLEDTWLLEWKIRTTKNGWRNTDYEPWREKVRASAGR